jgi:uncharacterized protein
LQNTARSFPRHYWNRIAFITEPTAHLVGQGIPFREAYRQAASEVSALSTMGREEALASYQVEGYPGHINRAKIYGLLEKHRKWS